MRYRCVDTSSGLKAVLAAISEQPRFALDTEFHRERTYRPEVALVQVAWEGGLALIDPLAVDLAALAKLFEADRVVVAHAAEQDLEVLEHCCGDVPRRLFDTQIAAGFVGLGTPSLSALHESLLGVRLPKGDRMNDWLARPLKQSMLEYASGDVKHLLEVQDRLVARLAELGREAWAEDECSALLTSPRRSQRPEDAWQKIKEARHLSRGDLPVARALAMWREQQAAQANRPVRHVLPDIAVVSIARAAPRTSAELAKVRGVSQGLANGRMAPAILRAVKEGVESDWRPPRRSPQQGKDSERLRPAVGLIRAWVAQTARRQMIHPPLLATNADIAALMRGDADARLSKGWRAAMVGAPIRLLLKGEAALAFDGDALVIEERSRRPVG